MAPRHSSPRRKAASAKRGKALDAPALAALGAERLADLLLELGRRDPAVKRRLQLAVAAGRGPVSAAEAIGRQLAAIERGQSWLDGPRVRVLVGDLEGHRRAIVEAVGAADPATALELMWRFLGLADSVFGRSDDGSGRLGDVFHAAVADLATLAARARPEPVALAGRVCALLLDNGYGQYDDLLEALAPALGAAGLGTLRRRLEALATPPPPPAESQRITGPRFPGLGSAGSRTGGPNGAPSLLDLLPAGSAGTAPAPEFRETEAAQRARRLAAHALRELADLQGDVDSFIALHDASARRRPAVAIDIAERLAAAGRAEEALAVLDGVDSEARWKDWEAARIAVLERLGRAAEAQAGRWALFETTLEAAPLREHLARLPDFADVEVEARALAHAAAWPDLDDALAFLVEWPAHEAAAAIVESRVAELDGEDFHALAPAAEALAGRHPLAATLLWRSMVEDALTHTRSGRYAHVARHVQDCTGVAPRIADFGRFEPHDAWVARLRREHARKWKFWRMFG